MKRHFLFSILILFTFSANAQRLIQSLDGDWQFQLDKDSVGWKSWANGIPESRTVTVPHTWNIEDGSELYYGTAWYQKDVPVPADWKGKQVRLRFEAVNRNTVVYLNGRKIGENIGSGYTPFSFDVSKLLRYGSENKIVVSVNNFFSDFSFPYQASFDWNNDGGIIRPVSFVVTGKPSVRYAHVKPETDFVNRTSTAEIRIKTWEESVKKAQFNLTFSDYQTKEVIRQETVELTAQNGLFITNMDFMDIKPWHFDDPNLYVLKVEVLEKGQITDDYTTRFGFRKVEIRGDKFYLNDEPVRLAGIEYMPGSHPLWGMAEPVAISSEAVDLMKDLNCVITRFHWQQDERLLDMLDERGMLVQEEVPWWQAPGNLSPEMEALAKKHIDLMIERDFNRPSIFAWGIGNENQSNTDRDIYRRLIAHARTWDSNALVTVVSDHTPRNLADNETLLADLPTWNDYVGCLHPGVNEDAPGMLQSINENALIGRPLLITEFGFLEFAGMNLLGGDARRIVDMSFHYNMYAKNDFVAGCIFFCLNNFRSKHAVFGKGRYQHWMIGLTDEWFVKKPSYAAYKSLASPVHIEIQQSAKGTEADIVVHVKNSLPGYTLRNYKLAWKTSSGKTKEHILPELKPEDKYETTIDELSPREKPQLQVIRPTGYVAYEL